MDKESIERYLLSQRSTLFGRAFDIGDDASRAEAVDWLQHIFEEIEAREEVPA